MPRRRKTEQGPSLPYCVVGTGQAKCYDNSREIAPPKPGQPFYGQDAQYNGNQPAYKNNKDGTVTDLNTGLMWTQDPGRKNIRTSGRRGINVQSRRLYGLAPAVHKRIVFALQRQRY